jgi:hypothetical protein
VSKKKFIVKGLTLWPISVVATSTYFSIGRILFEEDVAKYCYPNDWCVTGVLSTFFKTEWHNLTLSNMWKICGVVVAIGVFFQYRRWLKEAPAAETGYFKRSGMDRGTPDWQKANEALGLGAERPKLAMSSAQGEFPDISWRHSLCVEPGLDLNRESLLAEKDAARMFAHAAAVSLAVGISIPIVVDEDGSGMIMILGIFGAIYSTILCLGEDSKAQKRLEAIRKFQKERGGDEYGNVFEPCRLWVEEQAGRLMLCAENASLGRSSMAYADLEGFSADRGEFEWLGRGGEKFADTRLVIAINRSSGMVVGRQGSYSLEEVARLRGNLHDEFMAPKAAILEKFAAVQREATAKKGERQGTDSPASSGGNDVPTSLG